MEEEDYLSSFPFLTVSLNRRMFRAMADINKTIVSTDSISAIAIPIAPNEVRFAK